jgi:LysM repeat protein
MQTIRTFFFFILLFAGTVAQSQNEAVILQYIQAYKELAIKEMQRTGVPASIKLAQGIHETSAGTSILVNKSNNHFGIKCKDTWRGPSVSHTDDAPNECFRKYENPLDSYRDHSDFLKGSTRYASLFNLDPLDYRSWAYGLKKAGYATNPRYPQVIIKLIEEYHLQDYTMIALNKTAPVNDAVIAVVNVPQIEPQSEPERLPVKKIELPSYPSGEFKINDTRVVYLKKGTALLAIAQEYNIPLARIFEFNDMQQQEVLPKDQLVYLQRKRRTGNAEFHTVVAGESLYEISQSQAIRLEALLEYNNLKPGTKPEPGQTLYLRAKPAWEGSTAK